MRGVLRLKFAGVFASASLALCAAAGAQDHAPAPMMASRAAPDPGPDTAAATERLKSDFRRAYSRVGKPKLAIFWNRKLDDQLSQWYTGSRNVDTREGGWNGGKGFTASQKRIDVENRFDDRPQPDELMSFEFGSGFTRTLLSSGVDIVDRDAIMRLTHSKAKEAADSVVVADYQQIEIDALAGYADYLAEVLYAPSASDDAPLTFMISIKEVKTGRVVSMFRSHNAMAEQNFTYKWVGTEDGYHRRRVLNPTARNAYDADGMRPGTPEHIGWSVAIQTMGELTKHWRS